MGDHALARVADDYALKGQRSLADVKRRTKRHLIPFFGGRRLVTLTSEDIAAYQGHRKRQGATPATINRELAILRRAFTLQKKAGVIYATPHVERLREDNARQSFIEPDQLVMLLANLPAPLRPVVEYGYYTGWRIRSEVLTLEWRHVDRAAEVVRLEAGRTKNNKARVLAYGSCPQLKAVIDRRWEAAEALAASGVVCPYVFHRYEGQPIRDIAHAWRVACDRAGAGLRGKIPHDL